MNALLSSIIDKVYTETVRPDYVDETLQAVLGSTLYLHTCDFFVRDIIANQAIFDNAAYIQTLDIQTMYRYRAIAYFRKYAPSLSTYQLDPSILPPLFDPITGSLVSRELLPLELITPTSILDDYGIEKTDVFYVAGDTLFIKSSTALQYGLVGWYGFPQANVNLYNSWIAREWPYAIVYDAAWKVLSMTGNLEQAVKYKSADGQKGMAVEMKNNLIISNITGVGY